VRGYILDIPGAGRIRTGGRLHRWQVIWKWSPDVPGGLSPPRSLLSCSPGTTFIFALVRRAPRWPLTRVQVRITSAAQSNFWAKISAMSVLGTVPIFIAVAFMQRYLVRGISLGAVKG